jgi:trehalose/maltose hydrolase-like predicted phosphorylase
MGNRIISLAVVLLTTASFYCKAQDSWSITAAELDANTYHGATVANGMIGFKSTVHPLQTEHIILAGAYDKARSGGVDVILKGINFMNAFLVIDGDTVSASDIVEHTQTLHFLEGCMTGRFIVKNKAHVTYSLYALRHLPFCGLMDITIMPMTDIRVLVVNKHLASDALCEVVSRKSGLTERSGSVRLLATDAVSVGGKLSVSAASAVIGQSEGVMCKGGEYRLAIVGACLSSAHHPDPANEAERQAIFAAFEGIDRLVSRHTAAWDELWQGDITIDGDLQAQQDVHNMLFQLYSSVRDGYSLSIAPMGLTSTGYSGHVFWDADLWMMPALLVLHPSLARQMVEYRIDRLDAARQHALAYGYRGAMYPWESSESGTEQTPVYALTGPFEHHITGCVALAAWQYFCVSRDTIWLRDRAWPLLRETALFWESRIETDAKGWHIRNVVCPDEWAMNVDDNAFTNAVAARNIEVAKIAARILGTELPIVGFSLSQAAKVPMIDGATREHASYQGESIKQADVGLLAYPLRAVTDTSQIRRDLEYYIPRIPHDNTPAMSDALFALLYARLGDAEKALHHFHEGYDEYLCPPFRQMAEEKNGHNPYFLTGAGGLLQAVMMGFAGYEITDDGIRQDTILLPKGWQRLSISRGRK